MTDYRQGCHNVILVGSQLCSGCRPLEKIDCIVRDQRRHVVPTPLSGTPHSSSSPCSVMALSDKRELF